MKYRGDARRVFMELRLWPKPGVYGPRVTVPTDKVTAIEDAYDQWGEPKQRAILHLEGGELLKVAESRESIVRLMTMDVALPVSDPVSQGWWSER